MRASTTTVRRAAAGVKPGYLVGVAASGQAAPALANGRFLALAALASWLVTEAFGLWMLSRWLARGGPDRARGNPEEVPPGLLAGHAGLAFAGFCCWVSFMLTGLPALAWLALGLLGPAIGLGVSTVTIWTPYPSRPSALQPGPQAAEASATTLGDEPPAVDLADEMLASLLAGPGPANDGNRRLAPLIPAAHGVTALMTFLFAMLAAISAL
jgi:hypothetical protein